MAQTNFPLQEVKLSAELDYVMMTEVAHNTSEFNSVMQLASHTPPEQSPHSNLLLLLFKAMAINYFNITSKKKDMTLEFNTNRTNSYFQLTQRASKEWAETVMLSALLICAYCIVCHANDDFELCKGDCVIWKMLKNSLQC